jgi:hypothetical protein
MTETGMSALSEYERAQIFFEMGDPAQAARLLEPVAELDPVEDYARSVSAGRWNGRAVTPRRSRTSGWPPRCGRTRSTATPSPAPNPEPAGKRTDGTIRSA